MKFANPVMLLLLALTLPALGIFLWWGWRKKRQLIGQFVQSRLLANLTVGVSATLQKIRLLLLLLGVSGLFLALAQPQWGFSWQETTFRGLDIYVAVDTSRSMLAEDVAPNRLSRAKLAIFDLMQLAKQDRLALIAFAGAAFLQCPLTIDDQAFRQTVESLDTTIIPQGGSSMAAAIDQAVAAIDKEHDNFKVLVIFSDGEDHESGALESARKAAQAGFRLFTVGVGTANGELLRAPDESGALSYIKDASGNVVKSRLNEALLTQIAAEADGFYLSLTAPKAMEVLYQRGLSTLPKSELKSRLMKQFHERFQWPLSLAFVLLALELFVPDRKRASPRTPARQSAKLELRKAVALGLAILTPLLLGAATSPSSAARLYADGDYASAQSAFQELLRSRPDDHRLHYNAGVAAYQNKDYTAAAGHFSSALASPDLALQQKAYYNLGNAFFRLGEKLTDRSLQQKTLEQSLRQFESALQLDANDPDAAANAELVRKKLREIPPPPPKPEKSPDQKEDQKDPKQQDQQQQNQQDPDKKEQQPEQQPQPSPDQDRQNQEQNKHQQSEPQTQQPQPQEDPNQSEQPKPSEQSETGEAKESDQTEPKEGPPQPAKDQAGSAKQMTPEQARQLLESQRGEEKNLQLRRQETRMRSSRIFKDW